MTLLLLIFAASPVSFEQTAECDRIELNSTYSADGCHLIDQWIFWRWNEVRQSYEVAEWRRYEKGRSALKETPEGCELTLFGEGVPRVVKAALYRRTWTQRDPEAVDKGFVAPEDRRRLFPLNDAPETGFDPLPPAPEGMR